MADHDEYNDGNESNRIDDTDARMKIQEMIDDLRVEQMNLIDPKSVTVDGKIEMLDQIFSQYINNGEQNNTADHQGKSVNVSQARLDIEAFSLLATISHLRIRAVTACSWSFRAADFASRIVKLLNPEDGSSTESLTPSNKQKLNEMVQPYWNMCVPLRPMLGAITLTKAETIPREKKQRQPKTKDAQVASQQSRPLRIDDIAEEDQNTKVAKHVEFIMDCLKKEYKRCNKQPVPFYNFVIDPKSFSNTVENIFYVSFLIKDGFVALQEDPENRLPTLQVTKKTRNMNEQNESMTPAFGAKRQLVVSLDQGTWKQMVDGLGLENAVIDQESKNRHIHKRPRQQ